MSLLHFLPSIVWSIIILGLTISPGKFFPAPKVVQADNFVHFFLFLVWMILTSYSMLKTRYFKAGTCHPLILTGLCGLGISVLIESIQYYVPGRNFSLPDMLANSTGVVCGYLIVSLFNKWKTI